MADRETIATYDRSVTEYERAVEDAGEDTGLTRFIAALPSGAYVLDVGCGPGHAAAALQSAGLHVDAFDASAEMVEAAKARGVAARQAVFADPLPESAYDGIWCSFSLLHAPRQDMPGILARLHAALRPGGILCLGLKTGDGAHRDRLGRFYTYYGEKEIEELIAAAGFTVVGRRTGVSRGLAGTVDPWISVTAHA